MKRIKNSAKYLFTGETYFTDFKSLQTLFYFINKFYL